MHYFISMIADFPTIIQSQMTQKNSLISSESISNTFCTCSSSFPANIQKNISKSEFHSSRETPETSPPPSETPGRVFKLDFMASGPSGIDGLLSDEAMTPAFCVLVHFVHPALVDSVLLVVVVGNNAVIGPTVRRKK